MKKIITACTIIATLVLTSCEGDKGEDGVNILGSIFETTVDFTPNNEYSNFVTIPSEIEVFESDIVLVYLLEDVFADDQGNPVDVWSQLPQTFFPFSQNQGTLVYNFDHTFIDVRLFLGADFPLDLLDNGFTNDQTFRIAVLPAEFADTTIDMDDLLETIDVSSINIVKLP